MVELSDASSAYLRLRWPTVATAAVVVALGSLGALVIVASVRNADVLSVVALALAILAFVIQIIVFVAQTWASSQQVVQTQTVNSETRALLSELQTQTRDTNVVLNAQYNKLLDRLLVVTKDATADATDVGDASTLSDVQDRLIEEIRRSRPTVDDAPPLDMTSQHSDRWRRSAGTGPQHWPRLVIVQRLVDSGFSDLSPRARRQLRSFAADWVDSSDRGIPEGFGKDPDDPAIVELVEGDYVKSSDAPALDGDLRFYSLTAKGRAAARLYNARLPVPPEILEVVPWLAEERQL